MHVDILTLFQDVVSCCFLLLFLKIMLLVKISPSVLSQDSCSVGILLHLCLTKLHGVFSCFWLPHVHRLDLSMVQYQ